MQVYYGIVENRQDPLQLGRCQVRIAGIHTADKSLLPTNDLAWATPVSPITSSAMNGIGTTPLGPVEGTTVIISFADGDRMQQPVMFGAIAGISRTPQPVELRDQGQINAAPVQREIQFETQEEPVSGTQLTLVDYETGSNQLTGSLRADMRVQGFGIQQGTTIVSIDSSNQVTISKAVTNYGRNIITFLPALTNLSSLTRSQEFNANEAITETPTFGTAQAVRPAPTQVNSEIPIVPPSGTASASQATEGIRALIAACDQVGLTTKEQKCALLGIVGGESAWVPKQEAYNYSASRMRAVYSFATASDVETYSRAPSKGMSRETFFSWAYGPQTRGAGFLGNDTPADGGRYYGRGFIQLTGKYNYARYARQAQQLGLNADILNNPELLNTDVNVSAIIAALYLKDRVSSEVSPTANPGYFMAAKRAVGNNTADIAARKLSFYEYFYGVDSGGVSRTAEPPVGDPQAVSEEEAAIVKDIEIANNRMARVAAYEQNTNDINDANPETNNNDIQAAVDLARANALATRERLIRSGVPESAFDFDREGNLTINPTSNFIDENPLNWNDDTSLPSFTPRQSIASLVRGSYQIGFRDPNSKYPLPDYINEPDTNRLARGITENTVIETKDNTRITGLPKGVVGGTWSQPAIPFGGQYPFNHVRESESGHIEEWDDTPGNERIHTYHRSGTYNEIDANGTQVNYIVGDNYVLMERNGNIHVAGECNITTEGQVNIFVQSDANIEVSQNANIEVGNNINVNAHRNIDMTAGGDMRVNVTGDYSVTAANIFNYTAGNMKSQADSGMHLQSGDLMYVSSKAGLQLHDAERVNIESGGTMDLLADGVFNVDYDQGHFGEGATGAGIADTIGSGLETESRKDSDGNDEWTFTPVEAGAPINRTFDPLLTAERSFGEVSSHETPDEWDTPEGRYQSNELQIAGQPNAPAAVTAESNTAQFGGVSAVPVDTTNIQGSDQFGNDFQLSEHFTLGMLIDGGVNGRHRLVDQMLSDGNTSRLYTVQEIVSNLASVAQNILEPALLVLPQGIDGFRTLWRINSGYRLRGVVGNESARSQHPKGQAIDIQIMGNGLQDKMRKNYEAVIELEKRVAYDQIILEYRNPTSNWIHISHNPDSTRRMAFTMVNDSTYRRDANGQPAGFYLLESIPPKNR